jgi:hypothetical protein
VDHSLFNRVLAHAVNASGGVDYEGTIRNRDVLDNYIAQLRLVQVKDLSNPEALAYWVNFYNALVIQSVIDHWPVKSVLNDFPGNAFFEQWKHATPLGELTLNQIENEVIRKRFHDPRVHFALNCASKGCPNLQPRPFVGEGLIGQLDAAAAAFVNDPAKTHLDFESGKAEVSMLFKWYADDFKAAGGALAFIAKYSNAPEKEKIPNLKVKYLEYDWNLNRR